MLKIVEKSPRVFALILSSAVLFGGIYGINWSNKLIICSPFFVFVLITTLVMTKIFEGKIAQVTTLLCLALNLLLQWMSLKWVHIFSFLGILSATYVSTHLFYRLTLISLPVRLFISLVGAILVDAMVMLPWELHTFPMLKFWSVVFRSIFYKTACASLMSLSCWVFSFWKDKTQATTNHRLFKTAGKI